MTDGATLADDAGSWAEAARTIGSALDVRPSDRIALLHPGDRLAPLDAALAGLTGCVVVEAPALSAEEVASWLEAERITVARLRPSEAHLIASFAHAPLPLLRVIAFSGERLLDPTVERWRTTAPSAKLFQIYGKASCSAVGRPTRTGVHPLAEVALEASDRGRPRPDGRIEPLTIDEDPALAERAISELEATALGLDGVREAVVVAEGEGLALHVGGALDPSAWSEALRALEREDADAIVLRAHRRLPRAPDGSILRSALATAPALAAASEGDTVALLHEEWARALRKSAAPDEDFFLLGGHSLLAARITARLNAKLDVAVPLSMFFRHPTIAAQARFIERLREAGPVASEVDESQRAPLSHAQERLWFYEQLSPGSRIHHVEWLFRLVLDPGEELDRELLGTAIRLVAERHAALRTTFHRDRDGLTQRVSSEVVWRHEEHDVSRAGAGAIRKARRMAKTRLREPFDLERGPIWRTILFTLGPRDYVLVLQLHHIATDAWSRGVWIREIAEIYGALADNRPPQLAAITIQPAAIARAQRAALARGALRRQREFWARTLGDLPSGLELSPDRPRPARPTHRANVVPLAVSPETTRALRRIARGEGATLFMAVLAALDIVLMRLSGQTDIVVGTPVSERDRRATQRIIGLLLNNVPIRVDLAGEPTFRECVVRCRDAARAALANAAYPFERLLAEVAGARSPARHPIFDVMLNLLPVGDRPIVAGPLTIRGLPIRSDTSPLDLLVTLRELPNGGLAGNLSCSRGVLGKTSARLLARRFERLLAVVAKEPEASCMRASLLSEDERRLVLVEWNATKAGPDPVPLVRTIEATIDRCPSDVALVRGGEQATFGELEAQANRLARVLAARGVGPECIVPVYLRRSFSVPIAVLAIMKAGGAFALLDPDVPPSRAQAMIAQTDPLVIVTERSLALALGPALAAHALYVDDAPEVAQASAERLDLVPSLDHLAYVSFTSGTTGQPKGVMITQRGLAHRIRWVRTLFPFTPGEVVCQKTPLGFIDAMWEILAPLREGVRTVYPTDGEASDPVALTRLMAETGVTRLMLVPTLLRALLDARSREGPWLPTLGLWMVGGEDVRRDLVREFLECRRDARLINLYGLSEVSGETTWQPLDRNMRGRVPIGVPGPNARTYVLDPLGEPCPISVWGELYIGGDGVGRGYLGAEDDRYMADPFVPGGRMFRSGDRARWRPDGVLECGGRLDQQLKVRGVRVEPGEIEAALMLVPEIKEAAVIARPAPNRELRLVAYVVPRESAERARLRPADLRSALRATLPEAMVPAAFVTLDALPLTANRKLDRAALPAPVIRAEEESRPKTATESALADIWRELLAKDGIVLEDVSLEDDFFALGGYSLLLARLAAQIRTAFVVVVPLAALFERTTLVTQAELVDQERAKGRTSAKIVRVPREPRMPLSFAQRRMWLADAAKSEHKEALVVAIGHRLIGPLDVARVERAMDGIAERHEALRTTFGAELGAPFHTVHDSLPRAHRRLDLSELDRPAANAEIARLFDGELLQPFDLENGPPWRSTLVRLSDTEHVLLVTMSHLVSDAFSIGVWLDELRRRYDEPDVALPAPAIQPSDFAVWQRRAVSFGELDPGRGYFRRMLGRRGVPPELPGNRASALDRALAVRARLPQSAVRDLQELARSHSTTLFAVLLAGAAALIAELTGDARPVLGILSAGREVAELGGVIGLFLNTIPVAVDTHGAPDFASILQRSRDALKGALTYGNVPFERIVSDVSAPRVPRRNPIVDVVLNQVPPVRRFGLSGITARPLKPPSVRSTHFDLMFRLVEGRQGLGIALEYRQGQFLEAQVQSWLERYVALLTSGL